MKRWLILGAMLLVPSLALAQGGMGGGCGAPGTPACSITGSISVTAVTKPPAFVGFGTLSVSTGSINLSTLTVGPGSPAWSMPIAGALYVKNAETSSGNLYVCPLGGSCTTSNGIPLGPGAAYGFNLGAAVTSPTVTATSTATAIAQW